MCLSGDWFYPNYENICVAGSSVLKIVLLKVTTKCADEMGTPLYNSQSILHFFLANLVSWTMYLSLKPSQKKKTVFFILSILYSTKRMLMVQLSRMFYYFLDILSHTVLFQLYFLVLHSILHLNSFSVKTEPGEKVSRYLYSPN